MQTVLATYREPFGLAPVVRKLPVGETLAGMAARMGGLPGDFAERGVICLNGHPVGRPLWGMIRPKAPAITEVTFHYPPQGGGGGGGGGGKNVLAIVASIGLSLLTAGIAGGAILGG